MAIITVAVAGGMIYATDQTKAKIQKAAYLESKGKPTITQSYEKNGETLTSILIDYDQNGKYDWKTTYHRKDGLVTKIETTAKKYVYDQIGAKRKSPTLTIVPNDAVIE